MVQTFSVKIDGGAEIHLSLTLDGEFIQKQQWRVIGGLDLITLVHEVKSQNILNINDFLEPVGNSMADLLLRELILKVKKQWVSGDDDSEVCHCRKVSEQAITRAILLGAHSLEKVRKRTSANTGCGACMNDVQGLISQRVQGA